MREVEFLFSIKEILDNNKIDIARFLIVCLVLVGCNAAPYVPGEPGGPWTETELLIVKAKLYAVYSRQKAVMKRLYGQSIGSDGGEPGAPKMVRLGFHDCLK